MINQKIFPYWTPVVFDETVSLKKPEWKRTEKFLSNLAGRLRIKGVQPGKVEQFLIDLTWRLGSWADQFAYWGHRKIHLTIKPSNPNQGHLQVLKVTQISMARTALKVSAYYCLLTFFTLPTLALSAVALIAKRIYKIYLNRLIAEQKESAKVMPKKLQEPEKPKEQIFQMPPSFISQKPQQENKVIAEELIGKTRIKLLTGSLTNDTSEAIVNAANVRLESGWGVCGVIFNDAGAGVFKECEEILNRRQIKSIKTGEAVLTSAGKLASKIKAIVHAVGPIVFSSPKQEDTDFLAQAYTSTLKLITAPQDHKDWISSNVAAMPPIRSIAFSSLSTGIFGYPLEQASATALKAIKDFIEKNPDALDEVRFVFLPLEMDEKKTARFYIKALEQLTAKPESV